MYDGEPRYGRHVAWYALVRALKPQVVVETGTDLGLGSIILAAAVLRNGTGQVVTMDNQPDSGALIGNPYATVSQKIGDSLDLIE